MTTRRSTSADVAHRAGVSRATVSYVLNDAPHQSIPHITRQRVLEAAIELDYTPHAAARALRKGESKLVLLVNTGVPYGTNLSLLIEALAGEVGVTGRSLVVWQQDDPTDLAATLAHLQPVIALALGRLDPAQRALLARLRIPLVEAGTDEPDPIDHGAVLQVRHLAERGHRRLGYVTTGEPELMMFAEPRLAAVLATCADLDLRAPRITEVSELADVCVPELAVELAGWVHGPDPVTGVACYNDVAAAACLAAAAHAGIDVPGSLAVVGMDDEPMSAYTQPPLTTVRLQMAEYAGHLWRLGAAELAGDSAPPPTGAVHVSLVSRAST